MVERPFRIEVRASEEERERWLSAAGGRGASLSEFVRRACDELARRRPERRLEGRALADARSHAGATRKELARAAGVPVSTIARWERGEARPDLSAQAELRREIAALGRREHARAPRERVPIEVELGRIPPDSARRYVEAKRAAGEEVAPEVLDALNLEEE